MAIAENKEEPQVLAPYVRVGIQNGNLYLGFGSIQRVIEDRAMWEPLLRLAEHYTVPRTASEAVGFLERVCGLDRSCARDTAAVLHDGDFLLPPGSYRPEERHSRSALFYGLSGADSSEVQERLRRSHVVLVGCGGLGNLVSVTLATAGIGELTLVDDDRVEMSNLSRQHLFTESDIGALKCDVLGRELRSRNSETVVRTLCHRVEERADLDALPRADLLVLSADAPGLVDLVNASCAATRQAWMNVCYVNDIAVWGPLVLPGKSGCWDCARLVARDSPGEGGLDALISELNRRYQPPSYGPTNMLAASLATLDVLRHLGGFGRPHALNRRVGLWTHELRVDHQDVPRTLDCPTCKTLGT